MSIDTKIKFVPLSFINTHEELKRQIINTTIWSFYAKNSEPDVLGNLLESTQYGYTASASDVGSHKLLRITDILNGSVTWEQVPYCDCNKSKEYLLQAGDILVARTGGTTGKSFLVKDVPNNAVFASYLIRLRAKDKKYERVIYSLMNSYLFWSQITELKSGSAQPNVNAEKLKKILIPKIKADNLPEIIEVLNGNLSINKELQGKISEVQNKLNQLEEISSEFSHQDAIITKLRQSFLQDAVQGKLVPQNHRDEPASELLMKIKADKEKLIAAGKLKKEKPLPPIKGNEIPFDLPDGWVWCRLGEIIYDTEGGKSPKCSNEPAQNDDWGVIKTTAVQEMFFLEQENKVLPKGFNINQQHKISEGDVLITRAGPKNRVGIVCCVENLSRNLILSDKTIRIIHPKPLLNSKYISIALNSPQIKPLIELKMTGMADSQVNISQDNMKGFPIPLPPFNEQKRIVEKLVSNNETISKLESEIQNSQQKAQELMQAVLQEAFN